VDLQPIVYSRCLGCGLVTAPRWHVREGDPPRPVPVEISCGNCGTDYTVTDPRELHTELDAVVWHSACRTAVPCPAIAHVVRCTQRGPGFTHSTGCGELITGPAAGGLPPPADDLPTTAAPATPVWAPPSATSPGPAPVDPWAPLTHRTRHRLE
jgi:hypothetical protein